MASIKEQILDYVKTQLEGVIPPAATTSVQKVSREVQELQNTNVFPVIYLPEPTETKNNIVNGLTTVFMELRVDCWLKNMYDDNVNFDVTTFLNDVEKAIMADTQQNKLAVDTTPKKNESCVWRKEKVAGVMLMFEVHYRHSILNPSTQVPSVLA